MPQMHVSSIRVLVHWCLKAVAAIASGFNATGQSPWWIVSTYPGLRKCMWLILRLRDADGHCARAGSCSALQVRCQLVKHTEGIPARGHSIHTQMHIHSGKCCEQPTVLWTNTSTVYRILLRINPVLEGHLQSFGVPEPSCVQRCLLVYYCAYASM